MYKVFEQAFPQAKWRELVPESVMTKFAASPGGSFPAPQYSNGLTMALAPAEANGASAGQKRLKGTGVVLIGDAAHCFPPDLGVSIGRLPVGIQNATDVGVGVSRAMAYSS